MKALDFPLLADENVHSDVIVFLREAGLDVESVSEQGQFGLPDTQVLQQATEAGRAVLTHDSDFGGLALMGHNLSGLSTFAQVISMQTLQ
jgi:predicted nuclease of predicted toxin-antitoxin system